MRLHSRFSALLLTLLTLASGVNAQELTSGQESSMATMSTQETINLLVGDIVEILPSHSLVDPTYTWILTQDRTFIEAGRAPIFRKRLIQPGRYSLYAEISSSDKSTHITRTFILDYKARQPGEVAMTPPAAQGSATIVATNPPLGSAQQVVLPADKQLLQLIPINPEVRPLALDLNGAVDYDNDGNSGNDIQSDLTFFQTDASPLFIWFAEPVSDTTLVVTAAAPDNQSTQNIRVVNSSVAEQQGLFESPLIVTIEPAGERTYSFKAAFESPPSSPMLLYQWEFGDGQQSLLQDPVHTYAEAGEFTVTLRVRNLANGKEIASHEETITVQGADTASSAASSEDMPPDENDGTEEPSSFSLGSMLLLAGIFIGSILIGVAAMFVIARLRRRGGKSLSDRIEQMEQTVLGKDGKPEASKAPATLSIAPPTAKQTQPPKEVAQREKENTTPNPLQQKPLAVEEKNAPSWLKSGLASATATVTPASSVPAASVPTTPKPQTPPATPAPKAPAAPTPATPAAEPAPKAAPVTSPAAASTPPWLQKTVPPPAATPVAAPAAAPATPAQPTPAAMSPATPVTPPKPATPPAPKTPATGTVPPWLQTPTSAPTTPSAPAAPQKPAAPAATPTPATPQTPPTPPSASTANQVAPQPIKEGDQPVAFIRAESLNQPKNPEPPVPGAPS